MLPFCLNAWYLLLVTPLVCSFWLGQSQNNYWAQFTTSWHTIVKVGNAPQKKDNLVFKQYAFTKITFHISLFENAFIVHSIIVIFDTNTSNMEQSVKYKNEVKCWSYFNILIVFPISLIISGIPCFVLTYEFVLYRERTCYVKGLHVQQW